MATGASTLLVEGWRFIPHSYAIINEFQCLELLRRPEVRLYHRDMPYSNPEWRREQGLLDAADEERIASIPELPAGRRPDLLLRLDYPYNVGPGDAGRTCVYGTAEMQCVPAMYMRDNVPLATAIEGSDTVIVTSSEWSKQGFIRSGARADRVVTIGNGFDPAIFHPTSAAERAELRRTAGWSGFVFLNVGAMTDNKGIPLLLKAFARVASVHPDVLLVTKGADALQRSEASLFNHIVGLTRAEQDVVVPRLRYFGATRTFESMAKLYQAADAYVSPYHAEGFNMPVLEAAACGLPVICTKGGSTEDFTRPGFALPIESSVLELEQSQGPPGRWLVPDLDSLVAQMLRAIEDPAIASSAKTAGPAYASAHHTWKHVVDRLLGALFRGA